jgi:uncharacterized Ntn-hydrolase superfamily protein
MTFSIVAQVGDAFGVAVASKFIAVGSVVPAARLGVGAVATQAFAKVSYKDDVLDLLASGSDPGTALATVTAADEGSATRQLGIVSATSQVTFTGAECNAWAGGLQGRDASGGYAIQGNILVGDRVVNQMEDAWLSSPHLPVSARLMHALLAGDRAGGDRRGRQSAALYVVAPGAGYDAGGVLADLRVDDHPDAPTELARLLDLNDLYFGPPSNVMPLEGPLGEEVRERLSKLGRGQDDLHEALGDWAGEANYEMRLSPDGIDARVLQALREATA